MTRFPIWFSLLIIVHFAFTRTNHARTAPKASVRGTESASSNVCSGERTRTSARPDTQNLLPDDLEALGSTQTGSAESDETGCCCLLKDTGPPPVWDCTGSTEGTESTEAQCKKDADDVGAKYKWHAGKCTGNE